MKAMLRLFFAMMLISSAGASAWADEAPGQAKAAGYGQGWAHHGRHQMGHDRAGRLLHHLLRHETELGLTAEQVSKLKTLSLDFDRAKIKTEAEIMVAERELRALIHDETADLAAIEAKVKQSEGLQSGLRVAAIKTRREAWSLLTPEQREKEKTELRQWMRRHQEG
jgi:periplasmic protein CpxP/Spy